MSNINKINKVVIAQEILDDINSKVSDTALDNVKTDLQNLIDEINSNLGTVRKPSVNTFDDLVVVYPSPQQGWLVKVEDSGLHYQYDDIVQDWYVVTMNPVPSATDTTDGLMKKEDKAKLDSVEQGAQKNLTPQELIDLIISLARHGSGLDADMLDGFHADEFAKALHNHDGLYYKKNEVDVKFNSKANTTALSSHINDNEKHVNTDEKNKWNKGVIHVGSTEPTDDSLFWLDTN